MTRASKESVLSLLESRRFDHLAELVAKRRGGIRYLFRLLYEREGLIRWLAVEGMGAVADRLAGEEPEAVRVILRKLLWSINDESGGIGWSAPECIGEIIYRRPEMFGEFASIIISYADEPMLRSGVLWAAGRIAQACPDLVREDVPGLKEFLFDGDPVVRGYTVRLLTIMAEGPDPKSRPMLEDGGVVPVYEGGLLKKVTVADLASVWFTL